MTISVTQEDICNGKRNSNNNCPVVLALNRQAGRGHSMDFGIYKKAGSKIHYFRTPSKVYEFVILFDAGKPVWPFEFELEPASPLLAEIVRECINEFHLR